MDTVFQQMLGVWKSMLSKGLLLFLTTEKREWNQTLLNIPVSLWSLTFSCVLITCKWTQSSERQIIISVNMKSEGWHFHTFHNPCALTENPTVD